MLSWFLSLLPKGANNAGNALASSGTDSSSHKQDVKAISGNDFNTSHLHIYHDASELPPYEELLTTSANQKFAVREALHQCVAALSQKSGVLLLATEEFRSTNDYLSLKQRLSVMYPGIREGIANPATLLSLYSGAGLHAKRTERKEGDEALSINLFRRVVEDGIRYRCTDIHIVLKAEAQSAVVLYRIDGIIQRRDRIPMEHALAAVSVAYNKLVESRSHSDGSFIRDEFQAAGIPFPDKDNPQYKLRWQSIPIAGGFKVVLRLLQTNQTKNADASPLDQQGYAPDHCRHLYAAARKPKGMIIVSGPTGSGKSTLLKALMTSSPNREQRIQYSLEDPVEYRMYLVHQISIQRPANDEDTKQILAAMRAVLRGDPDELMVGEIRDREMTALLKAMVLAGHLVMTSVHASSAIEIIKRITDDEIGIPRDVLDGRNFLSALVYQNLVPVLCTHCRMPAREASEEMFPASLRQILRDRFSLDSDAMYVTRRGGCKHCNYKGTDGQTVIAEVIRPDKEMRRLFRMGLDGEAEEYWRKTRRTGFDDPDCTGKTFVEHGLYKAFRGLIDPVTLDGIEPLEDYEVYRGSEVTQ